MSHRGARFPWLSLSENLISPKASTISSDNIIQQPAVAHLLHVHVATQIEAAGSRKCVLTSVRPTREAVLGKTKGINSTSYLGQFSLFSYSPKAAPNRQKCQNCVADELWICMVAEQRREGCWPFKYQKRRSHVIYGFTVKRVWIHPFQKARFVVIIRTSHLPDKGWVCQSVRMWSFVFLANKATLCMKGDGEQSAVHPVPECTWNKLWQTEKRDYLSYTGRSHHSIKRIKSSYIDGCPD